MSYHEVEKPSGPPPAIPGPLAPLTIVSQPHQHCWQAVGIVQGSRDLVRERVTGLVANYVAQSCECGEARAVLLRLAVHLAEE